MLHFSGTVRALCQRLTHLQEVAPARKSGRDRRPRVHIRVMQEPEGGRQFQTTGLKPPNVCVCERAYTFLQRRYKTSTQTQARRPARNSKKDTLQLHRSLRSCEEEATTVNRTTGGKPIVNHRANQHPRNLGCPRDKYTLPFFPRTRTQQLRQPNF